MFIGGPQQVRRAGLRGGQCGLQMRKDKGQLFSVGRVVQKIQQGETWHNPSHPHSLTLLQTEKQLAILAFPCNQFGAQEPGSNSEIKQFAAGFGVQFDMFEKINVNGSDTHPLWAFLKEKQGGLLGNSIKWNFTKFVIDKDGNPVARLGTIDDPIPKVEDQIVKYL